MPLQSIKINFYNSEACNNCSVNSYTVDNNARNAFILSFYI